MSGANQESIVVPNTKQKSTCMVQSDTPRTPRRLQQPPTGGWRRSGCCPRTTAPQTKTCGAASAARPCASCAGGSAPSCSQDQNILREGTMPLVGHRESGKSDTTSHRGFGPKPAHPLIMRVPRLSAATAALSSGISPLLCACDRPLLFFRRLLRHMQGGVCSSLLQSALPHTR